MPAAIITLTTDFGRHDSYAAQMKGVILSINPSATIVDISHDIGPQNVRQGALCLAFAYRYFPAGTIHVAVVDPGVGSSRRAICVAMHSQIFLAPDNGLLSWVSREAGSPAGTELSNRGYWRNDPSATFHGRDVFAPAAAHLSLNISPDKLGPPVHHWIQLPWPPVTRTADRVVGEVLAIDHFGNLICNVAASDLPASCPRISYGDVPIGRLARTYSEVQENELVALVGSSGLVEIAVRNGNAAQRLQAYVGAPVTFCIPSPV